MSGKGTFTCQKEAKKMETSDNNTISIQNDGSSFWSGSCEPDLTNFKFIGGKKITLESMWEDTFSALGEHNHEQDGKLKMDKTGL